MEMEAFGMSPTGSAISSAAACEDEGGLRRGPWTVEEDMLLVDYVAKHGEGRWNSLARCAGLRRTGKSCRLRWLNYLRPDVRRGNITPEEQLLILELHSRWGNRWSKIAQHLPGRTDNEIKNYWRTRVQKHAKQLKCDVNSKQFRDVMRYIWMPRLVERMRADAAAAGDMTASVPVTGTVMSSPGAHLGAYQDDVPNKANHYTSSSEPNPTVTMSPDTSSTLRSSLTEASHGAHFTSGTTPGNDGAVVRCGGESGSMGDDAIHSDVFGGSWSELLATTGLPEFEFGDLDDSMWSLEDNCLQQQYYC